MWRKRNQCSSIETTRTGDTKYTCEWCATSATGCSLVPVTGRYTSCSSFDTSPFFHSPNLIRKLNYCTSNEETPKIGLLSCPSGAVKEGQHLYAEPWISEWYPAICDQRWYNALSLYTSLHTNPFM